MRENRFKPPPGSRQRAGLLAVVVSIGIHGLSLLGELGGQTRGEGLMIAAGVVAPRHFGVGGLYKAVDQFTLGA